MSLITCLVQEHLIERDYTPLVDLAAMPIDALVFAYPDAF